MPREGKRMRIGRAIGVVVALALLAGCGTQVPAGHHGVKYLKFGEGTEMGKIYPEGFQWHLVWNSMYLYKTRTAESKESLLQFGSKRPSL